MTYVCMPKIYFRKVSSCCHCKIQLWILLALSKQINLPTKDGWMISFVCNFLCQNLWLNFLVPKKIFVNVDLIGLTSIQIKINIPINLLLRCNFRFSVFYFNWFCKHKISDIKSKLKDWNSILSVPRKVPNNLSFYQFEESLKQLITKFIQWSDESIWINFSRSTSLSFKQRTIESTEVNRPKILYAFRS